MGVTLKELLGENDLRPILIVHCLEINCERSTLRSCSSKMIPQYMGHKEEILSLNLLHFLPVPRTLVTQLAIGQQKLIH